LFFKQMGEGFSRRPNNETPFWKYNKKTNTYSKISSSGKSTNLAIKELTVVTYNVCFENDFFDQRCEHIFQLIQGKDIICLQEVVPDFLEKLKKETWVQDSYYLSTVHIEGSPTAYVCIILTTIQPKCIRHWQLPTVMGRDCLEAEFVLNGQKFSFATTHLESLNNPQKRKEQLIHISQYLQISPSAALLGDFNFDSEQNYCHLEIKRDAIRRGVPVENVETSFPTPKNEPIENDILKTLFSDFDDVWADCGLVSPNEKGYTYDSIKNNRIPGYERMRYDRILLKSQHWRPVSISLLGDDPIIATKVGGAKVFPSDHFGLIMKLATET